MYRVDQRGTDVGPTRLVAQAHVVDEPLVWLWVHDTYADHFAVVDDADVVVR